MNTSLKQYFSIGFGSGKSIRVSNTIVIKEDTCTSGSVSRCKVLLEIQISVNAERSMNCSKMSWQRLLYTTEQ